MERQIKPTPMREAGHKSNEMKETGEDRTDGKVE
jgi:hypothetical protein